MRQSLAARFKVDAMDVVSNVDEIASMELWYKLLNCRFRLAVSAGTDSFTNVADHYTPGGDRVYVPSGDRMRYECWVGSYKRGRSFAGNGPVIFLTVDGKEPGDDLHFPDSATHKVRAKATVRTRVPRERLEIVVNGETGHLEPDGTKRNEHWEENVVGEEFVDCDACVGAFAHTSPVYASIGNKAVASADDARFWVAWIDQLIAQVSDGGRFSTPERRKEVIELFRRAQDVYRRIANQGA
jgi:hypothetical protein